LKEHDRCCVADTEESAGLTLKGRRGDVPLDESSIYSEPFVVVTCAEQEPPVESACAKAVGLTAIEKFDLAAVEGVGGREKEL
jgi:hypothetical protein